MSRSKSKKKPREQTRLPGMRAGIWRAVLRSKRWILREEVKRVEAVAKTMS